MAAIPMTLSAHLYHIRLETVCCCSVVGQMTPDLSIKCKAFQEKTEDSILLKITLYILPHVLVELNDFNFHVRQPKNNVDLCRHKSLRFKVYTIRQRTFQPVLEQCAKKCISRQFFSYSSNQPTKMTRPQTDTDYSSILWYVGQTLKQCPRLHV